MKCTLGIVVCLLAIISFELTVGRLLSIKSDHEIVDVKEIEAEEDEVVRLVCDDSQLLRTNLTRHSWYSRASRKQPWEKVVDGERNSLQVKADMPRYYYCMTETTITTTTNGTSTTSEEEKSTEKRPLLIKVNASPRGGNGAFIVVLVLLILVCLASVSIFFYLYWKHRNRSAAAAFISVDDDHHHHQTESKEENGADDSGIDRYGYIVPLRGSERLENGEPLTRDSEYMEIEHPPLYENLASVNKNRH